MSARDGELRGVEVWGVTSGHEEEGQGFVGEGAELEPEGRGASACLSTSSNLLEPFVLQAGEQEVSQCQLMILSKP